MPVVISDEALREVGLGERKALVEIACRLFDTGKLTLWSGAKLAALSRVEFERELGRRRIPIYRPTPQDLAEDLAALSQFDEPHAR